MPLKLVLVDTDNQFSFDTGIELGYDFDMLYISTAEDTELIGMGKYHKHTNYRLIVQDGNGKFAIDDEDESDERYDLPNGE